MLSPLHYPYVTSLYYPLNQSSPHIHISITFTSTQLFLPQNEDTSYSFTHKVLNAPSPTHNSYFFREISWIEPTHSRRIYLSMKPITAVTLSTVPRHPKLPHIKPLLICTSFYLFHLTIDLSPMFQT